MSVALATLTARLLAQIPARNGVPGDYGQVVQDAVAQLGQDVPGVRHGTLAIEAGVASYDLPVDFAFLIELPKLHAAPSTGSLSGAGGAWWDGGGVLVTPGGLVPVPSANSGAGAGVEEGYELDFGSGQITFYPTPSYTLARPWCYAAGYVLDDAEIYQRLNENGARIALLYGQYLVLLAQAAAVADGWKYQVGDESADKTGQAKGLQAVADGILKQYQLAISGLKGRRQ